MMDKEVGREDGAHWGVGGSGGYLAGEKARGWSCGCCGRLARGFVEGEEERNAECGMLNGEGEEKDEV
jgi:hypothetical protein